MSDTALNLAIIELARAKPNKIGPYLAWDAHGMPVVAWWRDENQAFYFQSRQLNGAKWWAGPLPDAPADPWPLEV